MPLILNFDTSTKVCSVALSENDKVLSIREDKEGRNHASLLTVFINEALEEAGKSPDDLDAISVSKGPGSYTGLRIGVSTAKGMAYALSIPVIAIPTLKIMAAGYLSRETNYPENAIFCPMIDARRMEVFNGLFYANLEQLRETRAEIITEESLIEFRREKTVFIFGDGAEKCENVLKGNNVHIDKTFHISAAFMPELSIQAYNKKKFEDVAYFEPFYLKDFVATVPKKKVIP